MPTTDTATLVISCRADGTANINKFNNAVREADDSSQQLVKTLGGLFSTAAMLQFGRQAVRTFSDLQESTQKFYEVFKGVESQAAQEALNLEKNFGASARSAKSMLSLTGDLLTGWGFTREEALRLSVQVAQLGSDIASFSNYSGGAEGATIAITKAMLGETEMAKMLGIAIKTDSKEYKELYKSIQATRGTTDSQTKALAALQMAFQQKGNALGDFRRNIDSLANRGRILDNELEDLRANIGRGLADDVSRGQGAVISLLRTFNDLDAETQNVIVRTGTIAAGFLAAKTAIGTYNLASALTAKLTQNEAAAHTANAAAITAENLARSAVPASAPASVPANPVIAAGQALKSNKQDLLFAKHALQQGRAAGLEAREIQQLQKNYRELLVTRRGLMQQSVFASSAQQAAKFNGVVAGVNNTMANMNKRMALFPTFSRGLSRMAPMMTGLAGATRGATVAAIGLAKAFLPMLAISAGLAILEHFLTASKKAAEKSAAVAAKDLETMRERVRQNEEQRKSDIDRMKRYEELAALTDRTKEEQEELAALTGELNSRYDGLNAPLLKQNETLKETETLWKRVRGELDKYTESDRKRLIAAHENDKFAAGKLLLENMPLYKLSDSREDFEARAVVRQAVNRNDLNLLKERREVLKHTLTTDELTMLDDYIAKWEKLRELKSKPAASAPKGGSVPGGQEGESPEKANKALREIREKYFSRKWQLEFDSAKPEAQLSMLEKKLSETRSKLKELPERIESDTSERGIEKIKLRYRLLEQEGELSREIEERREAMAQKVLDKYQQQQQANAQFFSTLMEQYGRFRATAQQAVDASSTQALELQSRTMLQMPQGLIDEAKAASETSINTKKMAEILQNMKSEAAKQSSLLQQIKSNLTTSTVG